MLLFDDGGYYNIMIIINTLELWHLEKPWCTGEQAFLDHEEQSDSKLQEKDSWDWLLLSVL